LFHRGKPRKICAVGTLSGFYGEIACSNWLGNQIFDPLRGEFGQIDCGAAASAAPIRFVAEDHAAAKQDFSADRPRQGFGRWQAVNHWQDCFAAALTAFGLRWFHVKAVRLWRCKIVPYPTKWLAFGRPELYRVFLMKRSLRLCLGIALASYLGLDRSSTAAPAGEAQDLTARLARAGLSVSEVKAVDRAMARARDDLSKLWKSIFARDGLTFNSPAVKRYVNDNTARCGADFVPVDNAWYCKEDDTIWYDPVFLARMKKDLNGRSKRPVESVPVLVLTHEWGHAVAMRRGFGTTVVGSFRENDADCYAGAAIGELIKARRLPASVMRDAEELYEMIGAPYVPEARATIWNLFRRHGTGAERKLNFMIGADSGADHCRGEKTYRDILRKVTQPPEKGASAPPSSSAGK